MIAKDVFRKKVNKNSDLTLFQKRVLRATLDIPKGEVRTYAQVAERIRSPYAFRAVGQALKKNPYAPGVPCHRVIASSGSIGGYSGGLSKKRKLLAKEGVRCD